MGDYVKLVENTLRRIKEEEETPVELSVEEQKHYFKGWMLAKAAEDSAYISNTTEDVLEDFKDDMTPYFGEDTITLELSEFEAEIKDIKEKLEPTDEQPMGDNQTDENSPVDEPSDVEAPTSDEPTDEQEPVI